MYDDDCVVADSRDTLNELASVPPQVQIIAVAHISNYNGICAQLSAHATMIEVHNPATPEEEYRTHALTKTIDMFFPFAAFAPSSRLLERDVEIVAESPM